MVKTIEIKNVPDEVYAALAVEAKKNGMTLSEYMLSRMERLAAEYAEEKENAGKPTMAEWLDRLESREPVKLSESPAEIIRRHRDGGYPDEEPG